MIYIVTPFYPPSIGGLETLLKSITNLLRENGIHVTVVTMKRWQRGLTVHDLGVGEEISEWANFVRDALPEHLMPGDVVLFNSIGPNATEATMVAAKKMNKLGATTIFWVHTPDHLDRNCGSEEKIIDFIQCFDATISNSEKVVKRLRDFGSSASHVPSFIPDANLIPMSAPYPCRESVAYLGRLAARKRPSILLEVAQNIAPIPLIVQGARAFGADCVYDQFRESATRKVNIHLVPQSPKPDPTVCESRIFINPSTMETCSLSLLEAMNRGQIPVITQFPENKAVIEQAGILVSGANGKDFADGVFEALSCSLDLQVEARLRVHRYYSSSAVASKLFRALNVLC